MCVVMSCAHHISLPSTWSVVGPWWALKGEGGHVRWREGWLSAVIGLQKLRGGVEADKMKERGKDY
jgi:hypothetical protein